MTNKVLENSIRGVKYTLSLPERLIRSATAVFGGLLKESSDFLVPAAFKKTTLYRLFIGNLLRYAVENIGRVEGAYEDDERMEDEYAVKKTIGNGIEAVGVVAVGASPLWVFAILSDALGGTKTYFERMAQEFEKEGYLGEKFSLDTKGEFIDVLQNFSDSMATNIDTPPLNREELQENYDSMKAHFKELALRSQLSMGQVSEMWNEMIDTAAEQKRSLLEVAGLVTVGFMNKANKTKKSLKVSGKVSADLFYETWVQHYIDTMRDIRDQGYMNVMTQEMTPYIKSMTHNFSPEEVMITERLFSMETVGAIKGLKKKMADKRRKKRVQKARKKRMGKIAQMQDSPQAYLKPTFSDKEDDT